MTEGFDPYRKWLGIPPKDQPPHHYRLLGLEPFEPDPDVIATAADGRMAQVKKFQAGKYSALSQKVLNEIAAAKVTLLNTGKRAEYDRQLRERLEAAAKVAPKAAPPPARKPPPRAVVAAGDSAAETPADAVDIAAVCSFDAASVFAHVSDRSTRRKGPPWKIVVAVAGAAILLVVGLLIVFKPGDDTATAQRSPSQEDGATAPSQGGNKKASEKPQPNDSKPLPTKPDPNEQPKEKSKEPPEKPKPPVDPRLFPPGRTLAELIDPVSGEGEADPAPPKEPEKEGTPIAKKLPVPDEPALKQALRRVESAYRKELASAATTEALSALSAKLLKAAAETPGNLPAEKYALLGKALELAAQAGDLPSVLAVVDRIAQDYEVDALAMKANVLEEMLRSARVGPQLTAVGRQIAAMAIELAETAMVDDEYEAAGRFFKVAASAGKKIKDAQLVREVTTTRELDLKRLKARYAAAQAAIDALAADPADGEANLTAGRWYCFTKEQWEKGLGLLRKGADADLAALAERDLAAPTDANEQVALADQWWKLAAKEPALSRLHVQSRAEHWYEQALPKLSGLQKTEVEKRLEALRAAREAAGFIAGGAVQKGNVALASNGTTVRGVHEGAKCLFDGDSVNYGGGKGIAYSDIPCEWIIEFKKTYRLQHVRLLLFDKDPKDSDCNYTLATSTDGNKYTVLADRSKGQWSSWQEISFSPRPVKFIKLVGLKGTRWNTFCVVEFEAYCMTPPPLRK